MTDASLFNEKHADTIVRAVTLLHGNRLLITNLEDKMQFIKTDDGTVLQVIESTPVTKTELEKRVHKAAAALDQAKAELEQFNKLTEEPQDVTEEVAQPGVEQPGGNEPPVTESEAPVATPEPSVEATQPSDRVDTERQETPQESEPQPQAVEAPSQDGAVAPPLVLG